MTENDVVLRAFQLLSDAGVSSQSIHSELKPYRSVQGDIEVLTEKGWKKRGNYRGARLDLSIIDMKYWDDAYHISPKTSWRFLLFPVKGFHAAFEFKVRVRGNHPRIIHDAELLLKLKEENPSCEVFLVILDHEASERTLQTLAAKLVKYRETPLHIYPSLLSEQHI